MPTQTFAHRLKDGKRRNRQKSENKLAKSFGLRAKFISFLTPSTGCCPLLLLCRNVGRVPKRTQKTQAGICGHIMEPCIRPN